MTLLIDIKILLVALEVGITCVPRAAVVKRRILSREIVTLVPGADVCATALGKGARTGRELGGDDSVGSDPVGESILAVLNNGLASLVTVVSGASLARCDWGVVDELEEVLSVAGNDGNLLAVLAQSIELVGVGSLDLLAGDVGELSLGDKRLGLGTNKLLLQNNDLG